MTSRVIINDQVCPWSQTGHRSSQKSSVILTEKRLGYGIPFEGFDSLARSEAVDGSVILIGMVSTRGNLLDISYHWVIRLVVLQGAALLKSHQWKPGNNYLVHIGQLRHGSESNYRNISANAVNSESNYRNISANSVRSRNRIGQFRQGPDSTIGTSMPLRQGPDSSIGTSRPIPSRIGIKLSQYLGPFPQGSESNNCNITANSVKSGNNLSQHIKLFQGSESNSQHLVQFRQAPQ